MSAQQHAAATPEHSGFAPGGAIPDALLRHRPRLNPRAPAIENIAKVIGAGAAARLIASFGGSRVYIGQRPGPEDPVARAIGHAPALKLGAIFGGDRVWMPRDAGHETRRRVARLRREGWSVARIARELRLCERHVYKVLARLRDG